MLAIQLGCSTPISRNELPRWRLQQVVDSDIVFKPICTDYRAPGLTNVPPEGLTPVYLFNVTGASGDEVIRLTTALRQNGFRVDNNYISIDGTWILWAAGTGVLKTQDMADRVFSLMCALQFEHAQLVHARYNSAAEIGKLI